MARSRKATGTGAKDGGFAGFEGGFWDEEDEFEACSGSKHGRHVCSDQQCGKRNIRRAAEGDGRAVDGQGRILSISAIQ